jgi:hypothetical protein
MLSRTPETAYNGGVNAADNADYSHHDGRYPRRTPTGPPAEPPAPKWSELCPTGRFVFYEGDTPDDFIDQVKAATGFDPSSQGTWGEYIPYEVRLRNDPPGFHSYGFHCPVEHLDLIYGSRRWPMGS